jgi:MSHA biogenesis protein MshO
MRNYPLAHKGFTLIELITVVVILSIVAVMGSQFVVSSTQNYEATRTRALLVNTGRQAIEQMTRQLRIALPYSVISTMGGQCVKFMPIAAGGNYLPDPSTGIELSNTNPVIPVSPHQIEFGVPRWVSIGALASSELYSANPSSMAALSSRSETTITLAAQKTWARKSINRRFYLLDNPQAFCLVGTQLRFYRDQSTNSEDVNLSSAYDLMAEDVSAATGLTPFVLSSGSENRNALVTLNLAFASGTERVDFMQEVMIRNVP